MTLVILHEVFGGFGHVDGDLVLLQRENLGEIGELVVAEREKCAVMTLEISSVEAYYSKLLTFDGIRHIIIVLYHFKRCAAYAMCKTF